MVFACEYLEKRCRTHSGALWPLSCQPAFAGLVDAACLDKNQSFTVRGYILLSKFDSAYFELDWGNFTILDFQL